MLTAKTKSSNPDGAAEVPGVNQRSMTMAASNGLLSRITTILYRRKLSKQIASTLKRFVDGIADCPPPITLEQTRNVVCSYWVPCHGN